MSTRYGSWEYGGGNGMRVVMEVTRSPVYHTSTEVRYYVKIYTQNQWRYNDYQTLNLLGDLNGSVDYNNTSGTNSSGGGRILRYSTTYTYNYKSYEYGSSPGRVTFGGRVSGAYNGVTPSVSDSWSIPARPYDEPARPDNIEVTRPNRERMRITWDRYASTGSPYNSQLIQLRNRQGDGSWTGWYNEATVSGSATSYVKNGLQGNSVYDVRIRAQNSAGNSDWRYTNDRIGTKPARPDNLRASLRNDGSVYLRWSDPSYGPVTGYTKNFRIQRSTDGSTWANLAGGVTNTYFSDTTAPGGANQYRIRVEHTTPPTDFSDWTDSNIVQTQVPPLAPTALQPDTTVPVDLDDTLTLRWQHNDGGDGADQSMYSIEYSTDNGVTWTPLVTDVASSDPMHILPGGTLPNVADPYVWRVRTQGITEQGYGPWSSGATLRGRDAPVVTLTGPPATITAPEITATWTFSQAQGDTQAGYTATLYEEDGATEIESSTVLSAATSHTFDHYPEDGESYVVTVRVLTSTGMSSATASATTTLDLPEPAPLLITGEYQSCTGAVTLDIVPEPAVAPQVETVLADLERRVDGGPWLTLAKNMVVPTSFRDPLPSTTGTTEYRARSISGIPSYKMNPIVTVEGDDGGWGPDAEHWGFLSYGDGFGTTLRVQDELKPSETGDRARAVQPFLGRKKPVLLTGTNTERVLSLSGSLFWREECPVEEECYYSSTPDEWVTAGLEATVVCWRDHYGRRMFGSLSSVSIEHDTLMSASLSFKVTEVDYTEIYEEGT